jgi:4a-hydroxytetrahydrobiopterin dehydratase
LQELFQLEGVTLRPEAATWQADMDSVARELIGFGLKDGDPGPDVLPTPSRKKARLPGLTEDQLNRELEDLPGWEPWEDTTPREYPKSRQELRKNFVFSSFDAAIGFMAYLAPRFNGINHHPRWSNEWTTVQIRLTTWDADNKITSEDVRTAHMVDQARIEFLAQRSSR